MVGGCILDKGIQINYIGNNRLGVDSNRAGSGLNIELVSTGRAGGKQRCGFEMGYH